MENDTVETRSRFSKLFSKNTVKGAVALAAGTVIGVVLVNKLSSNNGDDNA